MKKKMIRCFLMSIIFAWSVTVFASEEQERIYLIQILNQLDAIKPLAIAASKEQSHSGRVLFHYTQFKDGNDKNHNGLLEDINQIKKGIEEKLNQTNTEPRIFESIVGDYIH